MRAGRRGTAAGRFCAFAAEKRERGSRNGGRGGGSPALPRRLRAAPQARSLVTTKTCAARGHGREADAACFLRRRVTPTASAHACTRPPRLSTRTHARPHRVDFALGLARSFLHSRVRGCRLRVGQPSRGRGDHGQGPGPSAGEPEAPRRPARDVQSQTRISQGCCEHTVAGAGFDFVRLFVLKISGLIIL